MTTAHPFNIPDVQGYQEFWAAFPDEARRRLAGQSVAVRRDPEGWRIVASAEHFEDLYDSLTAAGVDLGEIVFDRVHREEDAGVGIQLQ
jgi:hypothetical protein